MFDTNNLISKISVPASFGLAFIPPYILDLSGKIILGILLAILTVTIQEVWKKKVLSKILKDEDKK